MEQKYKLAHLQMVRILEFKESGLDNNPKLHSA